MEIFNKSIITSSSRKSNSKISNNYNLQKDIKSYREKVYSLQNRIQILKQEDSLFSSKIKNEKKKYEHLEKIKSEKNLQKKILVNLKKDKNIELNEKKEIIKLKHLTELNRIKSANELKKTTKQKNYSINLTENLENQLKQFEIEQKILKEKKKHVKKLRELEKDSLCNNIISKTISSKNLNQSKSTTILNSEINNLKKLYENLSKEENNYLNKLKETKKTYDNKNYLKKIKPSKSSKNFILKNKNLNNNIYKTEKDEIFNRLYNQKKKNNNIYHSRLLSYFEKKILLKELDNKIKKNLIKNKSNKKLKC